MGHFTESKLKIMCWQLSTRHRQWNDFSKRNVLSCRRKMSSDGAERVGAGSELQARAAAMGKARSPRVDRRVTGTDSIIVSAERRRLCPSSSVVRRSEHSVQCRGDNGRPEHTIETESAHELSTRTVGLDVSFAL